MSKDDIQETPLAKNDVIYFKLCRLDTVLRELVTNSGLEACLQSQLAESVMETDSSETTDTLAEQARVPSTPNARIEMIIECRSLPPTLFSAVHHSVGFEPFTDGNRASVLLNDVAAELMGPLSVIFCARLPSNSNVYDKAAGKLTQTWALQLDIFARRIDMVTEAGSLHRKPSNAMHIAKAVLHLPVKAVSDGHRGKMTSALRWSADALDCFQRINMTNAAANITSTADVNDDGTAGQQRASVGEASIAESVVVTTPTGTTTTPAPSHVKLTVKYLHIHCPSSNVRTAVESIVESIMSPAFKEVFQNQDRKQSKLSKVTVTVEGEVCRAIAQRHSRSVWGFETLSQLCSTVTDGLLDLNFHSVTNQTLNDVRTVRMAGTTCDLHSLGRTQLRACPEMTACLDRARPPLTPDNSSMADDVATPNVPAKQASSRGAAEERIIKSAVLADARPLPVVNVQLTKDRVPICVPSQSVLQHHETLRDDAKRRAVTTSRLEHDCCRALHVCSDTALWVAAQAQNQPLSTNVTPKVSQTVVKPDGKPAVPENADSPEAFLSEHPAHMANTTPLLKPMNLTAVQPSPAPGGSHLHAREVTKVGSYTTLNALIADEEKSAVGGARQNNQQQQLTDAEKLAMSRFVEQNVEEHTSGNISKLTWFVATDVVNTSLIRKCIGRTDGASDHVDNQHNSSKVTPHDKNEGNEKESKQQDTSSIPLRSEMEAVHLPTLVDVFACCVNNELFVSDATVGVGKNPLNQRYEAAPVILLDLCSNRLNRDAYADLILYTITSWYASMLKLLVAEHVHNSSYLDDPAMVAELLCRCIMALPRLLFTSADVDVTIVLKRKVSVMVAILDNRIVRRLNELHPSDTIATSALRKGVAPRGQDVLVLTLLRRLLTMPVVLRNCPNTCPMLQRGGTGGGVSTPRNSCVPEDGTVCRVPRASTVVQRYPSNISILSTTTANTGATSVNQQRTQRASFVSTKAQFVGTGSGGGSTARSAAGGRNKAAQSRMNKELNRVVSMSARSHLTGDDMAACFGLDGVCDASVRFCVAPETCSCYQDNTHIESVASLDDEEPEPVVPDIAVDGVEFVSSGPITRQDGDHFCQLRTAYKMKGQATWRTSVATL